VLVPDARVRLMLDPCRQACQAPALATTPGRPRSSGADVAATVEQFVPQMINFELVGGVNFKKGCYPGQEIVARSQYRGSVKRRAFVFESDALAQPGQEVFHSADTEQPAGMVINAASWQGSHRALVGRRRAGGRFAAPARRRTDTAHVAALRRRSSGCRAPRRSRLLPRAADALAGRRGMQAANCRVGCWLVCTLSRRAMAKRNLPMESTHADGVDDAWQRDIECSARAALAARIIGERHVEVFVPCA
jgi:folate-binding protein YgfZ